MSKVSIVQAGKHVLLLTVDDRGYPDVIDGLESENANKISAFARKAMTLVRKEVRDEQDD